MINFKIDLSSMPNIAKTRINQELEMSTRLLTPCLFNQAPTCKGGKPGDGLAKIEKALSAITSEPGLRLSIEQKIDKSLEAKLQAELEKLASQTN